MVYLSVSKVFVISLNNTLGPPFTSGVPIDINILVPVKTLLDFLDC